MSTALSAPPAPAGAALMPKIIVLKNGTLMPIAEAATRLLADRQERTADTAAAQIPGDIECNEEDHTRDHIEIEVFIESGSHAGGMGFANETPPTPPVTPDSAGAFSTCGKQIASTNVSSAR